MKNNKVIKLISSITLCSILGYTLPVMAYTKEETVYSKLNADGENYNTVVQAHIKNYNAQTSIKDISDLLNIENTNGYETFEKDGNTVVWNAEGKDIYYKGESKKQLPITCNIKYELDGIETKKEDIIGKKGNVKVILEYKNNEEHIVNINGKNEKLYTPFLVIAGTAINNETNKNITISEGKVIDDGSKAIAIGMAFPGMSESLNLDNLNLSNKIEIEMETESFELDTIGSFITPNIIESKEDLKKLDNLDQIYSKVSTLEAASNEILQGAKTLKDGTNEYSNKKEEFNSALKQFSTGMTSANESYVAIDNGISELNSNSKTLETGAKQISTGVEAISENLDLIAGGITNAKKGSIALETGEKELQGGISEILKQLDLGDNTETVKNLKALIKENNSTIEKLTNVNKQYKEQLKALGTQSTEPGKTQVATINAQIDANNGMIKLLTMNKQAQEQTLKTLENTTNSVSKLKGGIVKIQGGVAKLQEGNKELTEGLTTLDKGANELATKSKDLQKGSVTLYNGTKKLQNGTSKLSNGSTSMKQGLTTLDKSTLQLTNADNMLTEASVTIKNGANSLYEGIFKFNSEGIKPICSIVNGDLKSFSTRVKKLGELSLDYNNYSMLEEGENGKVQFIFLTDALKKDSKQKEDGQEAVLNDNNVKIENKEEEQ